MAEAMVIIRNFASETEAQITRHVLETHGIAAVVLRGDVAGLAIQLAVRHAESALALRILDAPFDSSSTFDAPFGDTNRLGRA